MSENKIIIPKDMIAEIRDIMNSARQSVATHVTNELIDAYWNIGRVIVEHEQDNQVRAKYGENTLKQLSKTLTKEFGKAFQGLIFKICVLFILHIQNARRCLAN